MEPRPPVPSAFTTRQPYHPTALERDPRAVRGPGERVGRDAVRTTPRRQDVDRDAGAVRRRDPELLVETTRRPLLDIRHDAKAVRRPRRLVAVRDPDRVRPVGGHDGDPALHRERQVAPVRGPARVAPRRQQRRCSSVEASDVDVPGIGVGDRRSVGGPRERLDVHGRIRDLGSATRRRIDQEQRPRARRSAGGSCDRERGARRRPCPHQREAQVRIAALDQLTAFPEIVRDPEAGVRLARQRAEACLDRVREPAVVGRDGRPREEDAGILAGDEGPTVEGLEIDRLDRAVIVDDDLVRTQDRVARMLDADRRGRARWGLAGSGSGVGPRRASQGEHEGSEDGDPCRAGGDPSVPPLPIPSALEPLEGLVGEGEAVADALEEISCLVHVCSPTRRRRLSRAREASPRTVPALTPRARPASSLE